MTAPTGSEFTRVQLRDLVIRSLTDQGFRVTNGSIRPPKQLTKERVRALHETAVKHRIAQAKNGLFRSEGYLLKYIASGTEICPRQIRPRLREVTPGSKEELLFRYASLHWSIPVSSGYGRRLRFLVMDENTEKLIGLIGLGDPIFNLGPRDEWIGWSVSDRKSRLTYVLDAFVLGAVPPYSFILGGKLVAMLAASNTVLDAFKRKYGGGNSIIARRVQDGRLALLTTTSALGRSSVYNRVRFHDRLMYHSVGFTKGSGEFHFSNGLYAAITGFAANHCQPTAKQAAWGKGFRNRREVLKKCLPVLGLSSEWLYHGIAREVYVIPLARNSRDFLRGIDGRLYPYHQSEDQLFSYFRDRWMLPRLSWDDRYRSWSNSDWTIWMEKSIGSP